MSGLAFLDLETTGLDPGRHDVWEIGLILRDKGEDRHHLYRVEPDLSRADPTGLRISRFYERTRDVAGPLAYVPISERWSDPVALAHRLARELDGRHLVGAVPSFDAAFLGRWLRRHGQCPTWHYHLIDVEALAVGYLNGRATAEERRTAPRHGLPWDSDEISRLCGVEPPGDGARHTALGDARWARDLYDAITGAA